MFQNSQPQQFFMSTEGECPYLPDQMERKIFTTLSGGNAQHVQDQLSLLGFRRSQNIVYCPACVNCGACVSVRIPVNDFSPSRSFRRILNRNRHLIREIRQAHATEEQYELFSQYIETRHADGGMSEMSIYDYAAMVEESDVRTQIFEYRGLENEHPGKLQGLALTDVMHDGLSMVYSFFDIDSSAQSMGTYMVLDHIELARRIGLDYVYLGYWVKNSPNMSYKARFAPIEAFVDQKWRRVENLNDLSVPRPTQPQNLLLRAHRAMAVPPIDSNQS